MYQKVKTKIMKLRILNQDGSLAIPQINSADISDQEEANIKSINDREVKSYFIEFEDGVKVSETHDIHDVDPNKVLSVTVQLT